MPSTQQSTDPELDRIERSIDIDAPAERVFDLVSRPGWWINQGEVDADPDLSYDGDVAVVVHQEYGTFRIQPLESDRPRYVSFRWLDRERPDAGTTVEFWVSERTGEPGGVTLRVLETGFAQPGKSTENIRSHVAENTEGWETELSAAARFVAGTGA